MIVGLLAQGTAEGIGIGAGGTAALAVLCLFIKRGFSVRVGDEKDQNDTPAHTVPVCPLHDGVAKDVTEIKSDVKAIMFHLMGAPKE